VDLGSSYLPSELQAAYLYAQLQGIDTIRQDRLHIWETYSRALKPLTESAQITLPLIPEETEHNGHIFHIRTETSTERNALLHHLKSNGILAVFHYIPLHSSPAGKYYGHFSGHDRFTTRESERLIRLPLYYALSEQDQTKVIDHVLQFFA
jgi:dTDP-4-amino-4,6-dideoxygalactose transaminase